MPEDPTVKSCRSCPSFLAADEAMERFPRMTGSPMCARLGTVLGRPTFDESQHKALWREVAGNCAGFGLEKPPALTADDRTVMLPIPELRNPDNIDQTAK